MARAGFDDQFSILRKRFVKGLSERNRNLNLALSNPGSPESLRIVLHQLIGAAGIFGYDDLGGLARTAMNALDANEHEKSAQAIIKVQAAMNQLSNAECNDTI